MEPLASWQTGVAMAVLSLLLIGVHNAWDAVVYQAFVLRGTPEP